MLLSSLIVFSVFFTTVTLAFNRIDLSKDEEKTLIKEDLSINTKLNVDVVNIALFGVDGRSDVEGDRTDTIMILTLDFVNGRIKLASIMRDLMVDIPQSQVKSQTYEKINSAYSYGGYQLAVKTINQNFDLNISDYIVVNFDCLVDTVDAVGGIDINIENDSILHWTNQYIMDVNDKVGKNDPFIAGIGEQHLTGVQSLAFCRNRYSDDDYVRTQRQRTVVKKIAEKAFKMDIVNALTTLTRVYPYIKTSLTLTEIKDYANAFFKLENREFTDFRLPVDGNSLGVTIDSVWFLIPGTLANNAVLLHQYLYEDNLYQPSEKLLSISEKIESIAASGSEFSQPTNENDPIMEKEQPIVEITEPEIENLVPTPSTLDENKENSVENENGTHTDELEKPSVPELDENEDVLPLHFTP